MADPRQVLAAGSDFQRDTIKQFWPELWEALGGNAPAASAVERRLRCPLCSPKNNRRAVRRIHRNGTPACQACLDSLDIIGHPLERQP